MLKNRCVYVYAVSMQGEEVPYYIGKGSLNRPYEPHGTVEKPTNVSNIRILAYGMSDVDARQAEILLIALHKRAHEGGTLVNLSDGGDGGPDIYTPLMEQKAHAFDVEWWKHNPTFRLMECDGYWVGNHHPVFYSHKYRSWSKTINPVPAEKLRKMRKQRLADKKWQKNHEESAYWRHQHRIEIQDFSK